MLDRPDPCAHMGAGSPRQPRNRRVMHGHCPGDRPAALAGVEALEGLGPLVVRELGFPADAHPFAGYSAFRSSTRRRRSSPTTAVHIARCRSRAGDLMRAQPVHFGLGGDQLREHSYDRSCRLNVGFAPQPPPIVRKGGDGCEREDCDAKVIAQSRSPSDHVVKERRMSGPRRSQKARSQALARALGNTRGSAERGPPRR